MKQNPIQEIKYGELVWLNPTTDITRREECLCLFCDNMTYNIETNCPIAQQLYEVCIEHNIAFMMTRCKNYKPANH